MKRSRRSGMQIYFSLEEISEIFHGIDSLEVCSEYDHEKGKIWDNIKSKCVKAEAKRMVTNRPLKNSTN